MQSIEKQRNPYFDNLKGILIVLVCMGHCVNLFRDSNPYCNYLFHLIYTFHMPLFFFISGYFSKNTDKTSRRAFEALIIPTLPFELAYYILHILTGADNTEPFLTPVFAYWFCFVLFFCRVMLPYLIKIRYIVPVTFALALAAGFNPNINEQMSLSRFLCMLPFFMLGYFATRENIDQIREINSILAIVLGVMAAVVIFAMLQFIGTDLGFTLRSPYGSNEGILLRGAQFALAVPLSVVVMKITPQKKTYLSIIGKRTLQIYFLHFYFTTVIKMYDPFADLYVINTLMMLLATAVIVTILSSQPVTKTYDSFVNATKKLIIM